MSSLNLSVLDDHLPKKWEVVAHLGKGGQGTVFKGLVDGVPAAIKVFHDDGEAERVIREVQALQKLESPHVVKMLGFCSVTIFQKVFQVVAYELLEGGDLDSLLGVGLEPVSEKKLCGIAHDVCSALEALWSINVVHRDVKPANIVAADERFVLVDLAFARHLDESSLTQTGWTVGTRDYMSPEHQRAWKKLTVDSDVYSLGVTLFELAVGELPSSDLGQAREMLTARRADLRVDLRELFLSMLALLPYERPQVEVIQSALAAMLKES